MESEKNTNELLKFIYQNRKILFFTGLIAGVASIVISLLMPVLYQSTAIVFPVATSTVSFNPDKNAKSSPMEFGDEENAQHLIQILKSSPLRNRIIQEFDLAKVYELDTSMENFYYKLGEEYASHINFKRTRYGSVEIMVLDKTPKLAANIANRIVQLIDTVKNNLIRERTVPAFKVNKIKLNHLYNELDNLNSELDSLSELGVVGEDARANLYKALSEANTPSEKAFFQNQVDINLKYGARYDALSYLRKQKIEKIALQEVSYEQAESNATQNFTQKFVIEKATPSDKKAKPKRSIIVIVFTFSAVFLMFIFLLIRRRYIEIKNNS